MLPRFFRFWRFAIVLLYLLLTCYQLGLPGLHYDEAKEAGVNAMQLLTGAPLTAFRGATISLFGWQLPLMVQDYIGALNVYLALPLLKLTGIGVPNLRVLSILTGLATLLLLERVVVEWIAECGDRGKAEGGRWKVESTHHALRTRQFAALLTITLLAASPSFVFWSRQGIFVTNLTQPLCLWAIWQGLRWLHTRRQSALAQAAFASGLAIYAKLLAVWVIAPFWGLVFCCWLTGRWGDGEVGRWGDGETGRWGDGEMGRWGDGETGRWGDKEKAESTLFTIRNSQFAIIVAASLLVAILPLLLFNWQTGGTLGSLGGNLTQSYYGVDNFAIGTNFWVRLQQVGQVLRGTQFDYLGGVFDNWFAPWLALLLIVVATIRNRRVMIAPLLLFLAAFAASLFTVSGLFVTHYALLQPLLLGILGMSFWVIGEENAECGMQNAEIASVSLIADRRSPITALRSLVSILLLVWFCFDLTNTLRYHRVLSQSGGLGDHSDATYHLAYYLRYNGLGAPIVLDWGIDAPVRYLSQGAVVPIEIFGYASISEADEGFADRLDPFLTNPANIYLLRVPNRTVFVGRREAFLTAVAKHGLTATLETQFAQRDGEVLFELWRVQ